MSEPQSPHTKSGAESEREPAERDEEPGFVGEQQTSTEIRTAIIQGETFDARAVQYAVVDGDAIFEGDIILGRDEDLQRETDRLRQEAAEQLRTLASEVEPGAVVDMPAPDGTTAEAAVASGQSSRWPGGVLPYELDFSLTPAAHAAVRQAIAHWHDNTRLAFRPRQSADTDWLVFQNGSGCSSPVGRRGGRQDVYIAAGCGAGSAIHEIGHAVGLWHEQSREDRDRFVRILWQNVEFGKWHNFDQHVWDADDIGAYDYGSIMHYAPTAFGTTDPATGAINTTIVAIQTLPPGVTMGQRSGLSIGDRAAVAWMYGWVYPEAGNVWLGRFVGQSGTELLYYSPARRRWYLGQTQAGALRFVAVGDANLGGPLWTGDFTGDGMTDVLSYSPASDNWWLGQVYVEDAQCAGLRDQVAEKRGTVAVILQELEGLDPQDEQDRAEIAAIFRRVAAEEDLIEVLERQEAQLGCPRQAPLNALGLALDWSLVGNTVGFGHAINDGRPFWIGDFNGGLRADVLFYFPGDDNWWLGTIDAGTGQLTWRLVGNTALALGRAINDGRPFWIGDFNGDGRSDVLSYFPANDNWWLGTIDAGTGQLTWRLVGNTVGFGRAINDGRPFWIGDFNGDGRSDVLFYFPGDDNWWLGTVDPATGQLTWSFVGNREGSGRTFWIGDFNGDGRTDLLSYFWSDDNWSLGTLVDQVDPESPQCAPLRQQITDGKDQIRQLEDVRSTLNWRDDEAEIRTINAQITGLNQQITAFQGQMAALGCPETPGPGGRQILWTLAGNTAGFGRGRMIDGRPIWIGDFTGDGHADVLFHFRGDLNWWRGSMSGNSLNWTLAGTW